jgi:hypothetical protein
VPPSLTDVADGYIKNVGEGVVLVSLMVSVDDATVVPAVDPVLILIVYASLPSVSESAIANIVKDPTFEFIVKLPLVAETSAVVAPTVQYSVVPLGTFVVVTFTVAFAPSFVDALATLYVGAGVVLVSFIVSIDDATVVPAVEPVLTLIV